MKVLIKRVETMGLEPHDPRLAKLSPRRTAAEVCEHVRPDQRRIGISANKRERLGTCISGRENVGNDVAGVDPDRL
jgi:hypothetical protein